MTPCPPIEMADGANLARAGLDKPRQDEEGLRRVNNPGLEPIPIAGNRDALWNLLFAYVPIGKPASTFPGHALMPSFCACPCRKTGIHFSGTCADVYQSLTLFTLLSRLRRGSRMFNQRDQPFETNYKLLNC